MTGHLTERAEKVQVPSHPVSDVYGYDRGTPIDRWYIEAFLEGYAGDIRGTILEVLDGEYALRLGGADSVVDIVDIDPENPLANLKLDLTVHGTLQASRYDAIVLTQTIQYLRDPGGALQNCHQALRRGGKLLLTCPSLGRMCTETPESDLWRFTPAGLEHLFSSYWPGEYKISSYGNLRTCLAALIGEAVEDLAVAEINQLDPRFPLVACAYACA